MLYERMQWAWVDVVKKKTRCLMYGNVHKRKIDTNSLWTAPGSGWNCRHSLWNCKHCCCGYGDNMSSKFFGKNVSLCTNRECKQKHTHSVCIHWQNLLNNKFITCNIERCKWRVTKNFFSFVSYWCCWYMKIKSFKSVQPTNWING